MGWGYRSVRPIRTQPSSQDRQVIDVAGIQKGAGEWGTFPLEVFLTSL